ncbi:hypothetical protein M427DRAFT_45974 [Gonapodya prolifera JEL478]|uniref:Uncharacterized protein n=1 Tax=Gonapodya prolifera (strain JEL478) TaxID=1344416 RepID=A0A139A8E6_GONPJ|nr:hypothetical protein M427DRAFT_45974 [Gonapodya prolifera JEL478]|eukprot:KXS13072.1 hypothetical protein M427DRAFT_45974 [Gonapodya prolifera JEL478]
MSQLSPLLMGLLVWQRNTRLRGGFYAKKWDTVPPDSYSIFQSGWLELQEKIANPEVQAKQRLLKHQNKPNQTSRGALWGVMKDGREIVIDGKDTLTASEIASWFDSQNGTKGSKGKISEHMRSGTPYKGYKFVSK